MSILVGEVISIRGVKITSKVYEESNKETLFLNGRKFKGISIREHVIVRRGFIDIVCIVEGEYLDEKSFESEEDNSRKYYLRKVDIKPIGYFENDAFFKGIKFLPMIKDQVFLISEEKITEIYSNNHHNFCIGKLLKEEINISLPWDKLFNSHIGIFGNTGSGKSNTLTKLYTTLFDRKRKEIGETSKFILIDFNGEYTGNQLLNSKYKNIYQLSTRINGADKFPIKEKQFWDTETLCMLFKATANTQTPFINRVVKNRKLFNNNQNSLGKYIVRTIYSVFDTTSPKRDCRTLLLEVASLMQNEELKEKLYEITWFSNKHKENYKTDTLWFNDGNCEERITNYFGDSITSINVSSLNSFDEFVIRINLQLTNDLLKGHAQFEHIQPLLKRAQSTISNLRHTIEIQTESNCDSDNDKILDVISLRKCNQETKKILPLLIAKQFYYSHRDSVKNPINKTLHIIIDEAHNILSTQSTREEESWKDYRLELFEEIIKEGRKFGVFLTLSSQRPADISQTIVSQIHNFFIHRLVNDKDLFLLDNTITTLDTLSKSMIPNLSKGCCIVTGTTFDLPLLMQIDLLEKQFQPDSDDADLQNLWCVN